MESNSGADPMRRGATIMFGLCSYCRSIKKALDQKGKPNGYDKIMVGRLVNPSYLSLWHIMTLTLITLVRTYQVYQHIFEWLNSHQTLPHWSPQPDVGEPVAAGRRSCMGRQHGILSPVPPQEKTMSVKTYSKSILWHAASSISL